jgi:hypothetical protein
MRRLYYEGDIVEYWNDKWIVFYVDNSEQDGYDLFEFSIRPYPEFDEAGERIDYGRNPTEQFSYSFHRTEKVPRELECLPIITPSIERLFSM